MVCQTVKLDTPCLFMTKSGCSFNGGECHPIVDECQGCDRAQEFPSGIYCITFPDPAAKWRTGLCNMATHVKKSNNSNKTTKINPLKAAKRNSR